VKSRRLWVAATRDVEPLLWLVAFAYAALVEPRADRHWTLCVFSLLGLPCPGCGLGRSLAYLLHGRLSEAWTAHKLGPLALVVGLDRIRAGLFHATRRHGLREFIPRAAPDEDDDRTGTAPCHHGRPTSRVPSPPIRRES
jgi:hypothetical protein